MVKVFVLFYLLLFIPTVNAENKSTGLKDFAENMYQASAQGLGLPHISKEVAEVTMTQSLVAQYLYVQKRLGFGDEIAGYKAGLTSQAGQKKFNVNGAISGVLFVQGNMRHTDELKLSEYRKLMLEMEIGFILAEDIDRPINEIEILKEKVVSIMPVIEMPNLAFLDLKNITGQDIIASNAISNRYLLGEPVSLPLSFSLNTLNVSLEHTLDDQIKVVNQGKGNDALNDQWKALLWLVNERLESGYHLRKGQFLITGALGKMIPANVGSYQANFEQLGMISFKIKK